MLFVTRTPPMWPIATFKWYKRLRSIKAQGLSKHSHTVPLTVRASHFGRKLTTKPQTFEVVEVQGACPGLRTASRKP